MGSLSILEIGQKINFAGRLKAKPLCVYGTETIPENAIPITSLNQCLVKAIFTAAFKENTPPLYFGKGAIDGCCPGGVGWTGYGKMAPLLDYFISYGTKEFRNGEAEFLKASPEVVRESKKAVGTISPLGSYTVISPCEECAKDTDVKAIICFGNAEQIRNLCSLIHFGSIEPFNAVNCAWGPFCSTILTYPAGLTEKAPKDSAYIGPVDPTGNCWFPEDHMALGIPIKLAIRICEDVDKSFITKRPQVAYPKH